MSRISTIKQRAKLRKNRSMSSVNNGRVAHHRLDLKVGPKHVTAQVIDPKKNAIATSTSTAKAIAGKNREENAKNVAADIASKLSTAKVKKVVLNRNGKKYHGIVKLFAEEVRKAGVEV